MNLAHLNDLRIFLENLGVRPNKRLSQNFLVDANIVRKIVQTADIQEGETILEIGPGPGALTEELLNSKASHVIAIEKDRKFAQSLARLQKDQRLIVREQDFLTVSLEQLEHAPFKVVANLPYQITTPILQKLCDAWQLFSSAWIMVQKEVGQRICATKNTRQMSACTIFVQTYCIPSLAFNVSRHCFYPEPKVDSCVIKLKFRKPPVQDPKSFLSLVHKAYQQRRKMLRSSLLIHQEPYARLRPEALDLEDWIQIYETQQTTP